MSSEDQYTLMRAPVVYQSAAPYSAAPYPTASTSGSMATDSCSALAQLALLGAVIGGAAAAGANIRRLQRQEVDAAGALADTGRAALATAAASAVAGAAASAVSQQGLLRLGVLFAGSTAVMYGIQRYLEGSIES